MNVAILLSKTARDSQEFQIHLSDLQVHVESFEGEVATLAFIRETSIRLGATVTVVPFGDYLLTPLALGWGGSGQLSVLVMRDHSEGKLRVQSFARTFAKRVLIMLCACRRRVRVRVLRSSNAARFGWLGVADPISMLATPESVEDIRIDWKLDSGVRWVGVLGAITQRKNIHLVLDSVRDLGDGFGILLAGPQDEQSENEINFARSRSDGPRIRVINRLLTDVELDSGIAAVDCVILAHSNEGPSGIFGKALAAGTPVVAAGARSLRKDCSRSPQESVWVPLTSQAVADGVRRVMARERPVAQGTSGIFADVLLGASERGAELESSAGITPVNG